MSKSASPIIGARGVNALLHVHASIPSNPPAVSNYTNTVTSLMMMGMKVDVIMMTCHIQVRPSK